MKRSERRSRYYAEVRRLTAEKGMKGPAGFTLDHIVPVSFGFKHGIPPALIASTRNIEMVPWVENVSKSHSITPEAIDILREWGLVDLADTEAFKKLR